VSAALSRRMRDIIALVIKRTLSSLK